MNILLIDGQVLSGETALDVVRQMMLDSFDGSESVGAYVAGVVSRAHKLAGIKLSVAGDTDEELADSLVREVLRAGLAQKVRHHRVRGEEQR